MGWGKGAKEEGEESKENRKNVSFSPPFATPREKKLKKTLTSAPRASITPATAPPVLSRSASYSARLATSPDEIVWNPELTSEQSLAQSPT